MATVGLELQPCCGNRTGIGVYTFEIAKRLYKDENISFCGRVFDFWGESGKFKEDIPFPVHTFRYLKYGVYRRIWSYTPIAYRRFFPETDLSVFFNYIVPPKVDGKVITTVHDLAFIRFPETLDKRNLTRIQRDIDRSIERSQKIITVSEFSKQEIIECLRVPRENIAVIPSAPSIAINNTASSVTKSRYDISKPFILYVGTIEPRKNLVRLISAFEKLKTETGIPHKLVLAGGTGWNNVDIYNKAKSTKFSEDVVFTGFVTESEKYMLYQAADIFVFPSIYEGFGLPPLEAMYFGCPVVAAAVSSLPEVVGNAAELIDPNDEVNIAQGIWNVLSDKAYREFLIKNGHKRVKEYSWDNTAHMIKNLCRATLGIM